MNYISYTDIVTTASAWDFNPKVALKVRVAYLKAKISEYKGNIRRIRGYILREQDLSSRILCRMTILGWEKEIRHKTWLLRAVKKPSVRVEKGVTDDMVRTAREVSWELVVGYIPKNRKIICPFHDDNNPSLSIKNFAYCFACNTPADQIKYIQKVRGFSFIEAVKYLNEFT